MTLSSWALALESSALGEWMRASALAYPIANVLHLLGLVSLVGPIVLLDLRLLGWRRDFELPALSRALTKCAVGGLIILAVTGFAMFSADAGPLLSSGVMRAKLCVIALGVLNAVVFRALWSSQLDKWDQRPPLLGRLQSLASILLWLTAGTLGRWIAYF